ncbi:MAG TPA: hypothetical protein VK808_04360 [Bacteroidia bacterium]|nr:hypothetical protein [Bacteroidia bacterium]
MAFIFLFYFSSLMVQPVVTLISNGLGQNKEVCTMKCCQHKLPVKKQAQKSPFGCCANDMSNPFAQCCCCIGFIPGQQNTSLVIMPNKSILTITYTGEMLPNYSSDCWRPPEMTA